MSDTAEMRRKMIEIGARYLARTITEIDDLQKMIVRLRAGDSAALKEIEILAHRIRGSGAVFGFAQLSDAAGAIEMLAVDSQGLPKKVSEAQLAERFTTYLQQLSAATHAASAAASAQKN